MRNFVRLACALVLVLVVAAALLPGGAEAAPAPRPDSESVDPPPPGLAYGGIPYGSMSGNVAEFYRQREVQQTAPSLLRRADYLQAPPRLFTL